MIRLMRAGPTDQRKSDQGGLGMSTESVLFLAESHHRPVDLELELECDLFP